LDLGPEDGYWRALTLAAFPVLGNLLGGLWAEVLQASFRTLSLALHAAAGILLAVVGVKLMPMALRTDQPWLIVLAFMGGGGFFVLLDHMLSLAQKRAGDEEESAAPWAIFFGAWVDLFTDGIMIGAGSTVSFHLALLLALGQISADIPEGFVTTEIFRRRGLSRTMRLSLSASFSLPILLGTTLGYSAVADQPEVVKLVLLAFSAGILITVAVEEMLPLAHKYKQARLSSLVFVGGFALFTLLSIYFE
jgi:ZIP family zinc transporter